MEAERAVRDDRRYTPNALSQDFADTATLTGADDSPEIEWWLVLAHHDDPALVGLRLALSEVEPLEIGRHSTLLQGAFADPNISRRHARIEIGSRGTPILFDENSHNGTFVNGTKTKEHPLASGDVLGIGKVLLLVDRGHTPLPMDPPAGITGCSHPISVALDSVAKVRQRTTNVLLVGESGTGKDTLAQLLHEETRSESPWVALRCGTLGIKTARDEVAKALAAADDGTLYVDGIGDLCEPGQLALLEALDRNSSSRPRIIASTTEPLFRLTGAGRIRPEFASRIQAWTIHLPPLRDRRSDIPVLAREFASRFCETEEVPPFAPEFIFRLLRHSWPGNARELEAIVERATVESDGKVIGTFEALDAILAEPRTLRAISTMGRAQRSEAFVVDGHGRWYSTPDGTKHELGRRKTLARLLAALVECRRSSPGDALGVDGLLARAWPQEKLLRRAGANRVYVAVTTLRKMGLRDLIARTESGYLLDPDVPLRIIDE